MRGEEGGGKEGGPSLKDGCLISFRVENVDERAVVSVGQPVVLKKVGPVCKTPLLELKGREIISRLVLLALRGSITVG